MTILVTGASGFIGSYIVQEGLDKGFEVWAGVRGTSSRGYLQDERIRFARLDLSNPTLLRQQLNQYKEQMGGKGWDYVVHAAGATKCLNEKDFFRTNTDGTRNLIDALRAEDMVPRRFVFISSLSIFGAIREKPVREPSADNPWIYSPILLTADKETRIPAVVRSIVKKSPRLSFRECAAIVNRAKDKKRQEGDVFQRVKKAVGEGSLLFWASSSWAVVYCVVRDCCGYEGGMKEFEQKAMNMALPKTFEHVCTKGAVQRTISNHPYMRLPIDKWKDNGASTREIVLKEFLRKLLL